MACLCETNCHICAGATKEFCQLFCFGGRENWILVTLADPSCFALMRFAGLGRIRCAKQDALRSFSEGGPMYYVYLIQSVSVQGKRYLGMTTDIKERLQEHNAGKSFHT